MQIIARGALHMIYIIFKYYNLNRIIYKRIYYIILHMDIDDEQFIN